MSLRIRTSMWLQKPPREEWCLRVIAETTDGDQVVMRTWFKEYEKGHKPPRQITDPIAQRMQRMAVLLLEGEIDDGDYCIEVSI